MLNSRRMNVGMPRVGQNPIFVVLIHLVLYCQRGSRYPFQLKIILGIEQQQQLLQSKYFVLLFKAVVNMKYPRIPVFHYFR